MSKENYWQTMHALLANGASAIVPEPFTADPRALAENPAVVQSSLALMRNAYTALLLRWKEAGGIVRSNENWRWKPVLEYSDPNHEREVGLEREIAKRDATGLMWTNQVPTSSGVFGSGGRRSAIDLVHRFSPDSLKLIELKVSADTPEFAAREIIVHGLLFLLARSELRSLQNFADKELLAATTVRLEVLAPFHYYENDDRWLETVFDKGIAELCQQLQPDVGMSFAFTTFPKWFLWPEHEMRLDEAVVGRHRRW